MTNDLDTRARAASAALHAAVHDLPVGATERRTRAPHGGRILLAAAAIIAVVAVAVSLVGRSPDDSGLATDGDGAVPRLVIDQPPAGMTATGATDLAGAGETGRPANSYWVYGNAGVEDPFAEGDLEVILFGSDRPADAQNGVAELTDLNGHEAWVSTATDARGWRSIIVKLEASTLGLASATLDHDELVAAAGQLDLGAASLSLPDVLGGLELLGTSTGEINLSTTPLPFPTAAGHVVGYGSEAGDKSIVLSVLRSGEEALPVARWALGTADRAVHVRGTTGWSASSDVDGSTVLVWQETPTVLVAVYARGVDERALVAVASSLRTATDDEWAELLTAGPGSDVPVPDDARARVSGEGTDGSTYSVYLNTSGFLNITLDAQGSGHSSFGGPLADQPLSVATMRTTGDNIIVAGHTTLGTEPGRRITADGESPVSGSEDHYEGGTVFAFITTPEELPAEIVVLNADGTVLGRTPLEEPGPDLGDTVAPESLGTTAANGD